ncbi:MAG: bifunctional phosphoribosyl-AMP cyclohydrolase/phosphoribosyl-ATP diphosphatase HisIE [Oscillospiraceae bacterium]|jgi:phosphoribosyl-ATP pyrophosphohydrolase/phosphoribosyl-AMP cyclohydrolase|nr:bifunctional phosphoribosyl-AMP cyclohydrolase/phosphoribosyl-ATP diphosphatase HisIE [Oscillospiraceae bacterium]
MLSIDALKFDDRGLIPAIVTDCRTKQVLTLAWMNRESLEISMREGRTCFWSRSRAELWRKGETSGCYQEIVDITADCDRDALVVRVNKAGPACHLGHESCFADRLFEGDMPADFSLDGLYALIMGRKTEMKADSYTSYLFASGLDKILKKVGEESAEVIIAAKGGEKAETVYEIADLVYHVMVLMAELGIGGADVLQELAGRHVIDKKVKQERML